MNKTNRLALVMSLGLAMTGCGGGDDGGASSNNKGSNPKPTNNGEKALPIMPILPEQPSIANNRNPQPDSALTSRDEALPPKPLLPPLPDKDLGPNVIPIEVSSAILERERKIADSINDQLSNKRSSCGMGRLSVDNNLNGVARNHIRYMKHVDTLANRIAANSHIEEVINGSESITGKSNPFYSGRTADERVFASDYKNKAYGATENIARVYYAENFKDASTIGNYLLASLLAGPYHMRSLLNDGLVDTGAAFSIYTPARAKNSTAYSLVINSGKSDLVKRSPYAQWGLLTYPCNGTGLVSQALFNESPNPFGTTRDLEKNPVGQPVYVRLDMDNPTKTPLQISNVVYKDVDRNISIPVQTITAENDVNKILDINESIIIPLTDNQKSCPDGKNNCGLLPYTQYEVSFDYEFYGEFINKVIRFNTGSYY
ncbi:MAG: hypothetical protein J6N72_10425 [Psychrobacter sp.]|nr:hypothetical protein [Psychrobacter sp.]